MSTHLVKHQKMTKRSIKEDALVTAAFRANDLWERHGRVILAVAGAAVLVAVLSVFVTRTRAQSEQRAQGDLFRAVLAVSQGDYVTGGPMLKELVDNSPGTKAARDALRYLGDVSMAQGKSGEAVTWYKKYIDKSGGDRAAVLAGTWGLAAAQEDNKAFADAAATYGDAAKRSSSENEKGRALLAQARCYLRAGQNAKAIETYRAAVALPLAEQPIHDAANARLGELQGVETK
jgi:tetratricopeptide (TPR) repeat protein